VTLTLMYLIFEVVLFTSLHWEIAKHNESLVERQMINVMY